MGALGLGAYYPNGEGGGGLAWPIWAPLPLWAFFWPPAASRFSLPLTPLHLSFYSRQPIARLCNSNRTLFGLFICSFCSRCILSLLCTRLPSTARSSSSVSGHCQLICASPLLLPCLPAIVAFDYRSNRRRTTDNNQNNHNLEHFDTANIGSTLSTIDK